MPRGPKPPPIPTILLLLLALLATTLAIGTTGCRTPQTRTLVVRIPCITIPPPRPPDEDAGAEALSWYEAALTAWSWGAWDACKPEGAAP